MFSLTTKIFYIDLVRGDVFLMDCLLNPVLEIHVILIE